MEGGALERMNGFPSETQFVEVHWREATWQEVRKTLEIDPWTPPKWWGNKPHPWILLIPRTQSSIGWAYSRTSELEFPSSFEEIRLLHEKHHHKPHCKLLNVTGNLQLGGDERLPVYIPAFLELNGYRTGCDLERPSAVLEMSRTLRKIHPTSWNRPQRESR